MAAILKSNRALPAEPVVYRFEDVACNAHRAIEEAHAQAAEIVAHAHREAETIRGRAEQEGRQAAREEAEQTARRELEAKLESLIPAIQSAVAQMNDARQAWMQHWQQQAVRLAIKIAQRVIRREVAASPQITLNLVREALEMAAGVPQVKIALNPADVEALGDRVGRLTREIAPAAHAEIVADPAISRGGCRVETRHGAIDQQMETQLERIETELMFL